MVFSDYVFLFVFLPVALACFWVTPLRFRTALLLAASYLFYGWVRYDFCLIMAASTLLDFGVGRGMENAASGRRRALLALSLVGNLGLLAWFKYRFFATTSYDSLAITMGWPTLDLGGHLILPAGISFYTFQSLSYSIDVYRGTIPPERNLLRFAAYIALFPQLVAGPIVRFADVRSALGRLAPTFDDLALGAQRFMLGLAKKVLIANQVAPFADALFAGGGQGALDAWVGTLGYAVQIAFDFSAYSDMAIGLGRMLGFRFPENFRSPYQACSVTDFWRRWHQTLGAWFRDYLYIPLGGNRKGKLRTTFNLAATMLLCGLWHGANATFLFWGAWHGLLLLLERARLFPCAEVRTVWNQASTFLLVTLGWVWFASSDLDEASRIFGLLFLSDGWGPWTLLWPSADRMPILALSLGLLIAWLAPASQEVARTRTPLRSILLVLIFLLSLLFLLFERDQSFLYFQF